MTDVLTPSQRSYCMSRIRSKNTGPELKLRRTLFRNGLRYKVKSLLAGKPDIVFSRARVVIFVDGCFWHGCPDHSRKPRTNAEYWGPKIEKNISKDAKVTLSLVRDGWFVIRLWEHQIKDDVEGCAFKIAQTVHGLT